MIRIDDACVGTAIGAVGLPSAYCHLYFDPVTKEACAPPILDGTVFDRVLGGRACAGVQLATITTPFLLAPSITVAPQMSMTLEPTAMGPCSQTLRVGGAAPIATSVRIALDVISGPVPEQHRLMHLVAQIAPQDCTTAVPTCVFDVDPAYVYRCE